VKGGTSYGATTISAAAASIASRTSGNSTQRAAPARYDFDRLTWRHNGIDRRLTDVHGRVIHEILS